MTTERTSLLRRADGRFAIKGVGPMMSQSQVASPFVTGSRRRRSLTSRMLRLIGDHPFAFWIPTLLVLASGLALAVADSLSGSADRLGLLLAVTLLASLLAGFTVARLVDGPDTSFQSIEEVENFCQIPVLGAVPINRVHLLRRS
jgi:hypothetical protein